ncbi:hypothetical protein QVD17_09598 [Tagetes erecta]|uniref:Uncharacterized protein n=1 Tax=Tagetes erecta TaxID=13708 RepID=A0AAD8L7N4_TARER|nr:hypothetical protein QVD17_09598 [Tagetes erecta]
MYRVMGNMSSAGVGEEVDEPEGFDEIDGGEAEGEVGGAGGEATGASVGDAVGTAETGDGGEATGAAVGESFGAAVEYQFNFACIYAVRSYRLREVFSPPCFSGHSCCFLNFRFRPLHFPRSTSGGDCSDNFGFCFQKWNLWSDQGFAIRECLWFCFCTVFDRVML